MARFLVMAELDTLFPSYLAGNLPIWLFWFQEGMDILLSRIFDVTVRRPSWNPSFTLSFCHCPLFCQMFCLMSSTLSTRKPLVTSFFSNPEELASSVLCWYASLSDPLIGISSSLRWGFNYFARSASHITNIVGMVLKDFRSWWSQFLPASPTTKDTINWVSGSIITEKCPKCHSSNWNKVLYFLTPTFLPHQDC